MSARDGARGAALRFATSALVGALVFGSPARAQDADAQTAADAAPAASTAPPIAGGFRMDISSVFGARCGPRSGVTEYVARLSQTGNEAMRGLLRVDTAYPAGGVRTVREVPWQLGPRGSATVRIAAPPGATPGSAFTASVLDERGVAIALAALPAPGAPSDAMLIDATPQGRLAFALRAANDPDPNAPPADTVSPLTGLGPGLTFCAVERDARDAPVLPRTTSGYSGVALVLIDAASLAAAGADERSSLADYVLSGGTLVIAPQRPDELRHANVAPFVGDDVRAEPGSAPLGTEHWMDPSSMPPGSLPRAATLVDAPAYRGSRLHRRTIAPLFPWGNADSVGATAEYGFGQVHVLGFNPAMPPALEDPWAVSIVTRLAVSSVGRRETRMLLRDDLNAQPVPAAVRRALDPNEHFRSGLGVAVVCLLAYALLAGPVLFRVAARKGAPERALRWLPAFAGLAFAGLVAVGTLSRGVQGRARRIGVMELPAGVARGALRRYRGFYAPDAGTLRLLAEGFGRSLYADVSSGSGFVSARYEGGRAVLHGLAVAPWTTSVVREEGFGSLPGAVSVQPDALGGIRVVNRTGSTLHEVLVLAPGGLQGWAFARLNPGEARAATAGTALGPVALAQLLTGAAPAGTTLSNPGDADWHPGFQIVSSIGGDTAHADAWDAVLSALPRIGSVTPTEPVVLARMEPPPDSVATDGSLRVDRDALIVRVVGWGGAP